MFVPTHNLIVVKAKTMKEEVKTESGIILEEEKKISEPSDITEGEIVSMGPDCKIEAKCGDNVYYQTHAANTVTIRGEDIQIVGEPSIIGVEVKSE